MPRILLLITDLEIGGTPTVVRELALRLRQGEDVLVDVACLGRWGPVADELKAAGVHVSALGAVGAWDLGIVSRLSALITNHKYDTVLSFLLHANAVAAAVSLAHPAVRFFQSIQTTQANPAWHWLVQRLVHRAARKVIVPSPSVAQVAVDRSIVPSGKLVIIPNAIDADGFAPSPVPLSDERPYPIGFLGRLDPVKRVGDLLAAVRQLDGLVHLHIFGDGVERQRITAAIETMGLSTQVTLHGAVARPQEALRQMGLLVLPSISEGFGMVLIEAMAAGVPVVARNVPGVRDVVHDGKNGVLAASLSVESLAQAISSVMGDVKLRRRLIEAARADVRQRFGWEGVLRQYREVLLLQ